MYQLQCPACLGAGHVWTWWGECGPYSVRCGRCGGTGRVHRRNDAGA
jgi:DnaJ-class molecular chaperone